MTVFNKIDLVVCGKAFSDTGIKPSVDSFEIRALIFTIFVMYENNVSSGMHLCNLKGFQQLLRIMTLKYM